MISTPFIFKEILVPLFYKATAATNSPCFNDSFMGYEILYTSPSILNDNFPSTISNITPTIDPGLIILTYFRLLFLLLLYEKHKCPVWA